nr:hypothetical protein Iba_chr13fCG9520 [Ipomoea batatas]
MCTVEIVLLVPVVALCWIVGWFSSFLPPSIQMISGGSGILHACLGGQHAGLLKHSSKVLRTYQITHGLTKILDSSVLQKSVEKRLGVLKICSLIYYISNLPDESAFSMLICTILQYRCFYHFV